MDAVTVFGNAHHEVIALFLADTPPRLQVLRELWDATRAALARWA